MSRKSFSCDEVDGFVSPGDLFSHSSEGEHLGESPRRVAYPDGYALEESEIEQKKVTNDQNSRGRRQKRKSSQEDPTQHTGTSARNKLKAKYKEWKRKKGEKRDGKSNPPGSRGNSDKPRRHIGRRQRRRRDDVRSSYRSSMRFRNREPSPEHMRRQSDPRSNVGQHNYSAANGRKGTVASDGEHFGIISEDGFSSDAQDRGEREQLAVRPDRLRFKMKERVKDWLDERREKLGRKKHQKKQKERKRKRFRFRSDEAVSSGADADVNESTDDDEESIEPTGTIRVSKISFRKKIREWVNTRRRNREMMRPKSPEIKEVQNSETQSRTFESVAELTDPPLRLPSIGGFEGAVLGGDGSFDLTATEVSTFSAHEGAQLSSSLPTSTFMHNMTMPNLLTVDDSMHNGGELRRKKLKGLALAKQKWKRWKNERSENYRHSRMSTKLGNSRIRYRSNRQRNQSGDESADKREDSENARRQNLGEGTKSISNESKHKGMEGARGGREDKLDKLAKKMKSWWREKKSVVNNVLDKHGLKQGFRGLTHSHSRPPGSPRLVILDDTELSRPALVLRSLPPNLQKSAILSLWDDLPLRSKEKSLRASGNHAVSSVEERLCSIHQRALGALVHSREPNELLPKDFRVTIPLSRKDRVASKLKKGLNKSSHSNHRFQKTHNASSTTQLMTNKKRKKIMRKGLKGKGSAFYWGYGQHISNERLLRLVLDCALQDPPPPVSSAVPCPACIYCGVATSLGRNENTGVGETKTGTVSRNDKVDIGRESDSNERLAARNYQALCTLLLAQVRRRIGLQILNYLAIGLESMLLDYRTRDDNNFAEMGSMTAGNSDLQNHRHGAGNNGIHNNRVDVNSPSIDEDSLGLKEEHECPVCADLLANPCVLRCDHEFCRLCLMKIAQLRITKYLQPLCPLCREPFSLTDVTVDASIASELYQMYSIYAGRIEDVSLDEEKIMTFLNAMMEERGEPDRILAVVDPKHDALLTSLNSSEIGSELIIQVALTVAMILAFLLGTLLTSIVSAMIYAKFNTMSRNRYVLICLITCVKVFVVYRYDYAVTS